MTISEFELKRCARVLDQYLVLKRPAAHLREQFDIGYRMSGGLSVELYETRADLRDPTVKVESGLAKAVFVQKDQRWQIYWQRADLEWVHYDPHPIVRQLDDFIKLVDEDSHGCFYG